MGVPVTHHQAVETPFAAQNILNQSRALTGVCSIDFVVGGHVAVGARVPLGDLEGHQVDFSKGSFGENAVDRLSLVFLVVADIVLDGGSHTG